MEQSNIKRNGQWQRWSFVLVCVLLFTLCSSVAFAATHTAILKITNPNSTVSDTTVLDSDGSSWTQVYVEIPAKLYMDKGWLDTDLDNLRFIDVDSGNIALSHWVQPKADGNLQINHLGVWLLVKDLDANETETIKIEMVDGGSFVANPRALSYQTHDRTSNDAAFAVFPFYAHTTGDSKWTNAGGGIVINKTLDSEDDYSVDTKTDDDAVTGNEFTVTIRDVHAHSGYDDGIKVYFLSDADYDDEDELATSEGYRLFLDDYDYDSDNLHYHRYYYTIKLQQYDKITGLWRTLAHTAWELYDNTNHVFDIKVSGNEIFLFINQQKYDFLPDGTSTITNGRYQRTDSFVSGHFGIDRGDWVSTNLNHIALRRFLAVEPSYEVYGNADLIITDTSSGITLGNDVTEISPDLQQFSKAVGGNTLEDYVFATYAIARSNQVIDTYKVRLENRSTSASEIFAWASYNSDSTKWVVYYCDSSGNNCTQTAPVTTTLAQGASITYTIKLLPTLSALVNGSSAQLTLAVEGQGDGSFDSVRFSASTYSNLGCFWEYKAQQVITWPGGHGYNDLLDYQVPIKLTGETDLQHALPDGSDIVITDDHNNVLDFWLKSFDRAAGDLEAWVKVPTLTGSSGDVNLYVWWGNENHATSRSDRQATFDLYEDWENDYANMDKVGCDDGTTEANVNGDNATNADLRIKSSCEGAAEDPHGWENVPTADDFYNWWEADTIDGRKILQADVSSTHKSHDKGPFLHRGGLGWDHYEVSYKFYTGTYYQYGGGGTFGNPQYNAVYFNDAGNMWGMEYFADKFIFRPYAAGIDYTWQYQSNATNLLGSRFPQNDRWYVAKVRIFKDKTTKQTHLKLYFSTPKEDPDNLPDVDAPNVNADSSVNFTKVADFVAPPAFTLDYGGIAFGGWDSGFGFDDIRVRKYTEDSSGDEPVVTNSTVTTNTVRPELTLASPQITAPIFGGRPAYIEIKATPFSWRGDFMAYYADCYVNGECETGEDNSHIGTISVFGQIDNDTAKGAGYSLLKRDPGENNPTVTTSTDRTIYTTDGSSTTLLNFEIAECSTLQADLDTIGTCDSTDNLLDETEKLIRFVRGYYVDDPAFPRSTNRNFDAVSGYGNDDGTADPDEQWKIADALHSNPLLVGVPNMVYGYSDYWSDYVDVQDGRDLVAYFMTNDGMLHAIQLAAVDANGVYQPTSEAKELWAFIPHAALAKLKQTRDAEHEYVADGLLRAIDIKVDTGDGQGEVWRTVLFGLGGRDNTYVFGMDVTDPDNPVLIWEMDADSAGRIGTTISAPALGRIDSDNDGSLDKWVAVVGSGYDLDYLENYETSTAWLTVIDLADGTILKQLKVSDKVGNVLTDLAVLRNATTGAIEKIYFGDYYGALWRVTGDRIGRTDVSAPLADGDTLSDTIDVNHTRCDLLYKPTDYATTSVPDDPDYPVVAQPRIARGVNSNEYWVYFGSGDYDEYDVSYPHQSFFGLKDKLDTAAPYEFSDLTDMTFSTGANAAASSWYIQLGENADSTLGEADIDFINNTTNGTITAKNRNERVMKRAEVYGGFVFFTTYEPLDTPCGGGKSRFYAVGYRSGAFQSGLFLNLKDSSGNSLNDVRSVELETGGVPSQPMIMEGQSGGGTAVASGVTTSSSGGIEKVELNPQAFSTALDILLWREKR